jgi:hypothetical protein
MSHPTRRLALLLAVTLAGLAAVLPTRAPARAAAVAATWRSLPPEAAAAGVRLAPPPPATPRVTAAGAVALARDRAGTLATGAAVTATLGLFSDDAYTVDTQAGRTHPVQRRLAWLVAFTGTTLRPRGPTTATNTEVDVAVDATTGEVVELVSYR